MKAAIICSLLLATLHVLNSAPTTISSKTFHDDAPVTPQAGITFKQGFESGNLEGKKRSSRELTGRIGSRPPSCAHKCRGCVPCDAIQIPASTDRRTVESSNYEPEGWKCKCGASFFDP